MSDHDYEPQADTKIGKLLAAMRAVAQERPIWTPDEAAKVMGVQRSAVPPYLVSALSHRLVFRRTGQSSYELSLKPFEAVPAGSNYEKFIPTKTSAPRPGTDVPHPRRTAPNLCTGCSKAACWDNGCQSPAKAEPEPASAPTPAPTPSPAPTAAPEPPLTTQVEHVGAEVRRDWDRPGYDVPMAEAKASISEEVGGEDNEGIDEVAPDAFYSCRTGEIILVGLEPDEEGRITIPADLVSLIKRQITWSLAR